MTTSTCALLLSRVSAPGPAEALRDAVLGFRLTALGGLSAEERTDQQTLLLTRLRGVTEALPGASRAVEVRYVVTPACAANDWRETVACYLLARLTCWGTPVRARREAAAFVETLRDLLAGTLPAFRFAPLQTRTEVTAALRPFPIVDTVEIRRRRLEGDPALALPLLGVVSAESVIELLLRQHTPSLLACCVEPAEGASLAEAGAGEELVVARVGAEPRALRYRMAAEAAETLESLAAAYEGLSLQRWRVQHLAALRLAPFRLRIQLAGAAPLGDAVVNSLAGEVGGPGRFTANAAWRDPTLPVAGGAERVRPRSSRTGEGGRTQFALAADNLAGLAFAVWEAARAGVGADPYLADLGEVARLLPLPCHAPWLPAQGVAQPLAFRAAAPEGVRLGVNRVRGVPRPVHLPLASRHLHTWIVGQTGTGKSTLLESLILQDVYAGRGVIAVDPHGDLIRQVMGKIPAERVEDVILFDPADKAFPLGMNPLEAADEDQQAMVVSAFIDLLIKLYDPLHMGIIGPRFEHGARNVMYTVMSVPGNTLVEVLRAFQDDDFVFKTLLPHVTDPIVKRYWTDQIRNTNSYHRSEVLDWLVSKFSHFVTDRTMRRILGQSKSSFAFREAMDGGKIVLVSLAKGILGAANANFLGLILLPMVLHAALSRAELPDAARRDVALYVDEFQNYATDSLALMLAEARKYKVALTLANQHVGQLTQEVRDAVIGNVGSMLAFRLGAADAAAMEAMLAPSPVDAADLVSLPNFTAYGRIQVDGHRCPAFTLETEPVGIAYDEARAQVVREHSRGRYGRPRAEVDVEIAARAHLG